MWYAAKSAANPERYRPIWTRDELVFLDTFSTSNSKNQVEGRVKFEARDEAYDSTKNILIAVASQIKSGVNLATASSMILLDFSWKNSEMQQLIGRVSRSSMIQKAPFTEVFFMVGRYPTPTKENTYQYKKLEKGMTANKCAKQIQAGEETV